VCLSDAAVVEEPACYEPPQALPRGFEPDPNSYLVPFSWSPDGLTIAAVGQPFVTQTDTDLWLLDAATGGWTSLTDDNYEGALAATETVPAAPADVSIEVQPAWSPDGTQLAVERTVTNEERALGSSTISLINAATGEIRDLSPLPGHETHPVDASSITGITWSPDGSTLAISVRHRELDMENDGVWLVNVDSGELTPLVSVDTAI
jgi:Tol biopolymer transport system component